MIVCCTLISRVDGIERCIYVGNSELVGKVEISTKNCDGSKDVVITSDGAELIKAIENAMNV